ncbi:BQ5605_C020g09124 [Microbotryum silenes-dioicae]|uniref:BQ5605_C020g09124 protein n=1 Tax=Microbotryum silenes-dioicae TaxID=796604 RepID=A0A2X0PKF2_9BASI|nr:BQ5605_C020g09124 [Microbotryum silenes-dioicae]
MHFQNRPQRKVSTMFRLSAYLCLFQSTAIWTLVTATGPESPGVFRYKVTLPSSKYQHQDQYGILNVQHFVEHKTSVEEKYRNNQATAALNNLTSPNGVSLRSANFRARRDLDTIDLDGFHNHKQQIESKYRSNQQLAAVNQATSATDFVFRKANALTPRSSKNFARGQSTALNKRGGASSATVALAGFKQESGNFVDLKVSIGSRQEKFDVVMDTGSGDLWVPGSSCKTKRNRFSGRSDTLYLSGQSWSINYRSGSTVGTIVRDSVQVGDLTIKQQLFALADQISPSINELPTDGVLGFAFSSIATGQMTTFFENLLITNAISQPLIAFSLNYATPTGELVIGGTDSSKFQAASMQYHNVTARGYWQIACEGIVIDGHVVQGTKMDAAIDTGTALMLIPTDVATALFHAIPGSHQSTTSGWLVPCQSAIETIGLSFGGITYKVPFSELFLGQDPTDASQCKLAITTSSATDLNQNPVAIIGSAFLHTVYTILTYKDPKNGQPAVGFAQLLGGSGGGATGVRSPIKTLGSGSGGASGASPGNQSTTQTPPPSVNLPPGSSAGNPTGDNSSSSQDLNPDAPGNLTTINPVLPQLPTVPSVNNISSSSTPFSPDSSAASITTLPLSFLLALVSAALALLA